jgi:hypothetical protein
VAKRSQNSGRSSGLKPFKPGQSGNPGGRPKLAPELKEYLDEHRGPLTIKALITTEKLLDSKDQQVAARVANDWLNKVLPNAVNVEQELAAGLVRLKQEFENEPETYERALAALAGRPRRGGTSADRGGPPDGSSGSGGGGGETVHPAPAEPAPG